MRSSTFALVTALLLTPATALMLAVTAEAVAGDAASTSAHATEADASSDTGDSSTPGATTGSSQDAAAAPAPEGDSAAKSIVLGPVGKDARGRTGRIHVVQKGDTLWDVSDAYLGTPWVWPSIWSDNGSIADPDTIHPGERIWITPHEMRRVTESEADELIAAGDHGAFPADLEMDGMPGHAPRETYAYTERHATGFVSAEEVMGDASIVDGPTDRMLLSSPDQVLIGLGVGAVAVGDQFEIFRTSDRVFDPDSGVFVGFATRELGWLEITEVHAESSTGVIRETRADISRGDHVRPRYMVSPEIELRQPPEVEGRVVYTPDSRLNMATSDIVYLDRGAEDGLEVGSPLEIYRILGEGDDEVQGRVALPDKVVAKLLVVEAREQTAVAVVTHTRGELLRGDRFRGSPSIAP